MACAFTAFLVGLLVGPWLVRLLRKWKVQEKTQKTDSAELNRLNAKKSKTPTMGGLMLLPALVVSLLLWGNLANPYVMCAVLGTVGFTLIGIIDDFIKLRYPRRKGLTSATKERFWAEPAVR